MRILFTSSKYLKKGSKSYITSINNSCNYLIILLKNPQLCLERVPREWTTPIVDSSYLPQFKSNCNLILLLCIFFNKLNEKRYYRFCGWLSPRPTVVNSQILPTNKLYINIYFLYIIWKLLSQGISQIGPIKTSKYFPVIRGDGTIPIAEFALKLGMIRTTKAPHIVSRHFRQFCV